jgi:hypothetical protein
MSEKQEIFKSELYNKFFIELKKNENIDKETFYNSEFELFDYYELEEKINSIKCVCGIKILKAYILNSKILNKCIIIGSECLSNFEKDQKVLKNTFVKQCVLCQNLNMGKNRTICNDCKQRDKCIKCKLHIPKHPFKMCNFCTFKQVPINEGKQILGRYGNIPIYILYGTYGPYLNWFNKNISIPKHYIKDNTISLESAIHLIKWKCQQSAF